MVSTRRGKKQLDPLVFLVDRSISNDIPKVLNARGFDAYSLADLYGERKAQYVPDPRWIRRSANEGWVGLTRDELWPWRTIIREHRARIFRVARAAKNSRQQCEFLWDNLSRIELYARKPGPYICRVDAGSLALVWS